MTPERLAQIHGAAFPSHARWDSQSFQNFLKDPAVRLFTGTDGFLLVRHAAPEAEILTLAVHPSARRKGNATNLIDQMIKNLAENQFESVFLEVSTENAAAIALYEKHGFQQVGRRKGYYRSPGNAAVDAVVMSRAIGLPTTKKHP